MGSSAKMEALRAQMEALDARISSVDRPMPVSSFLTDVEEEEPLRSVSERRDEEAATPARTGIAPAAAAVDGDARLRAALGGSSMSLHASRHSVRVLGSTLAETQERRKVEGALRSAVRARRAEEEGGLAPSIEGRRLAACASPAAKARVGEALAGARGGTKAPAGLLASHLLLLVTRAAGRIQLAWRRHAARAALKARGRAKAAAGSGGKQSGHAGSRVAAGAPAADDCGG